MSFSRARDSVLLLLLTSLPAAGMVDDSTRSTKQYTWKEVVVTATRHEGNIFDLPFSISTLPSERIARMPNLMTPDIVGEPNTITMQRTTAGGGAPILRGMIGYYNLILINGVRLNNSTYRSGPNQYLNTIDAAVIDRVEILKGPQSSLYGSDAIGGVVNIITKRPLLRQGWKSLFSTRYRSADRAVMTTVEESIGGERIGVLGEISYKKFGDIRGGGGVGVQKPTAFSELDGYLASEIRIAESELLNVSIQSSNQYDVPRYDRILAGNDIKNTYEPQQRHLFHTNFTHFFDSSVLSELTIDASIHQQLEGTNIISAKKRTVEIRDRVSTRTASASLLLRSRELNGHVLTFGGEFLQDNIVGTRDTIRESFSTAGFPPYPNRPSFANTAAFVQDEWMIDRFQIGGGLRYSLFQFRGTINNVVNGIYLGDVRTSPSAVCGNIRAIYQIDPGRLNVFGSISQGFRAPNSNNLMAIGVVSNFGVEVPNPDLRPERSLMYEAGLKFQDESVNGELVAYINSLTDFIQQRAVGIENGVTLYKKVNVEASVIRGTELTVSTHLPYDLYGSFGGTYTFGENRTDDQPLSKIPPAQAQCLLGFEEKSGFVEAVFHYAFAQHRLSSADSADSRIGPGGTAAYFLASIRGGWTPSDAFRFTLGIENILDRAYKIHGSGIYSPGRNAFFSIALAL